MVGGGRTGGSDLRAEELCIAERKFSGDVEIGEYEYDAEYMYVAGWMVVGVICRERQRHTDGDFQKRERRRFVSWRERA